MELGFENKTAIVTGAARGIGRAAAIELAWSGVSVVVSDIDGEALENTAIEINGGGGHSFAVPGDLTAKEFPSVLVDAAVTRFGGLDIIVNNAGYTWDSVIQKTMDEQFSAMLDIHTVAPFRLLRAASEWFRSSAKAQDVGQRYMRKVVNVSSISGIDGNPGQSGYSAGKAAIIGLTRTLAKEWGRYGVNVNAVAFGLIDTRLTYPMESVNTQISVGDRHVRVGMKSAVREEASQRIPLGRLGKVAEAAGCITFLCSSLSDYVTGEVLVCSGGLHF